MPKGIPKKPGEEQTLEGGGAGAGAGVRRGAYTTKKQQARIDAMTDEERAASMNVGKQFEILSPVAEKAQAKIAKGNIGADEVLKNLREKFNVSKESFNAKRDIRDPSMVSEEERVRALRKFERNKALEGTTTEGGVTKYPYVEPTEKKKGGLTASRRGDGIASRGKTKGRMV